MRDRLIELIRQARKKTKDSNSTLEREMIFAEHLLANGVIVPPCKVGDTVYVICNYTVQETTVFSLKMETEDGKYVFYIHAKAVDGAELTIDGEYVAVFKTFRFGKAVFLTKEEAEEALKGGAE